MLKFAGVWLMHSREEDRTRYFGQIVFPGTLTPSSALSEMPTRTSAFPDAEIGKRHAKCISKSMRHADHVQRQRIVEIFLILIERTIAR